MIVEKTGKEVCAVPDYYSIYLRWTEIAKKSGKNEDFVEAQRYARLAEEFGLAIILDDDTVEF